MFDVGYFFNGILRLIGNLLQLYMWVIIVRAVISWIRPDPYNPIVQFLYRITDPVLNRVRRYLPNSLWYTGLDFSPLILILLLIIVQHFLSSIRF